MKDSARKAETRRRTPTCLPSAGLGLQLCRLRFATRSKKEDGAATRSRERAALSEQLERERMRLEDESGCIETISEVLDKNNRTNAWQQLDASVVEESLGALILYVHRRPEGCQELCDSRGCVRAIVTGMQECSRNSFIQEKGLRLIDDACLTLESCAEAFVGAGALEAIANAMDRFVSDWKMQACGCDAISSLVASLSDDGELLGAVLEAGVPIVAARAIERHIRSEDVLVAGLRALETIALRCGAPGRFLVQEALSTRSRSRPHPDDDNDATESSSPQSDCNNRCDGGYTGLQSFRGKGDEVEAEKETAVVEKAGATGFALRLAGAYGRDDSQIIVQRGGAARVGACALNLVRALLTDHEKVLRRTTTPETEGVPSAFVDEFFNEKGVDVIISVMEYHIHDPILLIAAWQAMHAVVCLARSEQKMPRRGRASNALTGRGENLKLIVRATVRSMELHLTVAPIQWICLVCLAGLHALDATTSNALFAHSGIQVLYRCIRVNSRHAAVVEQACRVVATMSDSLTSRTRFVAEKVQDAIHEVVYLHKRHAGVQVLGNRALDALLGYGVSRARQKTLAEQRPHEDSRLRLIKESSGHL